MTTVASFLVIGDVNVDIIATLLSPVNEGSDTPARIEHRPGGSAANLAAGLASLGAKATLIGCLGDDALGRDARIALERKGVVVRARQVAGATTGTCIVLVGPRGERTMIPDAGANDLLAETDLPTDVTGEDHVHISGYALLRPGPRSAALAAIDGARRVHASLSVDASSAAPLHDLGAESFLSWISGADLLFANLDEARVLTGVSDPRDAARRLTRAASTVVVKLGAAGSVAASAGGREWHCAASASRVIDTTGAGDAFAAGFLFAWGAGRPLPECLASGDAQAARAVAVVGARP